MSFLDFTKQRFSDVNSVLCLGLDPVYEEIPIKKESIEKTISFYFQELIEHFNKYVLALKPNIAFYEQYGFEGLRALKTIIDYARQQKIPIILDAKRGDIGATSKAYAKAAFEDLKADAITLAPYMGTDSVSPFFEYKNKGFFILARTSNPGSSDFQMLKVDNQYLYEKVIKKIVSWSKDFNVYAGAVAGATHMDELATIAHYFKEHDCPPILIPGVGKQGGALKDVIATLREVNYDLSSIFINSSSKILYAYKEHRELSYLEASEVEIKKMLL